MPQWFEDAEPAVLEACRAAVALLQERGLSLVPVHLAEKGCQHLLAGSGEMAPMCTLGEHAC